MRQDIDGRYADLAGYVQQQRDQIGQHEPPPPPPLRRDTVDGAFISAITTEPVRLLRQDKDSEREYALYRGAVWECERELQPNQWRILADAYTEREEAEFAFALGLQQPGQNRDGIPTGVRRAVWVRDNGRCTQCGSRESLEYDHIIPVSKGGSNTERNIELLCEVCNRRKSDEIV